MKDLISFINEASGKAMSVKSGEDFYAIVCNYEQMRKTSVRDMIPVKFSVKSSTPTANKEGLLIQVNSNKLNIKTIYLPQSENRSDFYNGIANPLSYDNEAKKCYLFCAKTLEDLQKLMDSEVSNQIEDNLKEIANLTNEINNMQNKIKKLQEDNIKLKNSAKLK